MDFFLKDRHGVSIYACSFPIGIGEDDSTPEGYFVVTRGGKLTDPDWKNPRTREYFAGGDPKNPIGKFWIGLTGTDEQTKDLVGYGIHGTIDPDSIGKTSSMGCIRLLTGDVELVFKTLVGQYSTVQIQK
jgi:lipoprotein-anchoring transpeptidase ErfK/SrfK